MRPPSRSPHERVDITGLTGITEAQRARCSHWVRSNGNQWLMRETQATCATSTDCLRVNSTALGRAVHRRRHPGYRRERLYQRAHRSAFAETEGLRVSYAFAGWQEVWTRLASGEPILIRDTYANSRPAVR
jgi:hypothetical protein